MTRPLNHPIISLVILGGIALFLWQFATNPVFFEWSFTRHQNVLSWWARPVLMLPFCYLAYRRSFNGILLSIAAILTSMFWFPVPETIDPQVLEFLQMEKDYLTSGWTLKNIIGLIAILLFFFLVALAFWKRSIKIGIFIAAFGAIAKMFWSIFASPEAGASVIPFALSGIVLLAVSIGLYALFHKYR